jgi:hypothetical protein
MSSRGIPEVLMQKVDEYVDSLAPQIQPRIAAELETFQQKTIDSLETQVIDAFRSLFNKDKPVSSDGSRGPWNLNDAAPDAYGGQSLPFADEIAKLTRSFGQISDEAGSDLQDIFNLSESRGVPDQSRSQDGDFARGAKGFLTSAFSAVQEHLDQGQNSGGQGFQIGGVLGMLSNTIKDASQNPEEKARLISPEIKQSVGDKLRVQHASIAEQFTRIALDHIKRWLRGNTSTRDLGDGAKAEIADQVGDLVKGLGGLFGSKKSSNGELAKSMIRAVARLVVEVFPVSSATNSAPVLPKYIARSVSSSAKFWAKLKSNCSNCCQISSRALWRKSSAAIPSIHSSTVMPLARQTVASRRTSRPSFSTRSAHSCKRCKRLCARVFWVWSMAVTADSSVRAGSSYKQSWSRRCSDICPT